MFLTQQVTLHFHAMWHADDHNYLFGKFLLTRKKYIDEMTINDQGVIDSACLGYGVQNYRFSYAQYHGHYGRTKHPHSVSVSMEIVNTLNLLAL